MCCFDRINMFGTWEKHIILNIILLTFENVRGIEQGPSVDEKNEGMTKQGFSGDEMLLLHTV